MYVLGANENLIETLRLIAQSAESRPLFPAGDDDEAPSNHGDTKVYEARALLTEDVGACCSASERHWLILVAKEWEPHVLDAIADVARLCISQSANHATARIMVMKREPCAGDFELLRDHLSATRESWRVEWANAYEKYSRLGKSAARIEYLAKAERWARPAQLDFHLIYMDEPNLLEKIREFAEIPATNKFAIVDATKEMDDALNCFVKPPALHWTNYPREADVQVSFKFTFPIGTVTDSLFRAWSATVRDCYGWEYTYEWTNGVFARQQLVKVALVRGPNNIVEITGRIDKDEADEEDEEEREDGQTRKKSDATNAKANGCDAHWGQPLHRVWPYFAKAFECFLADIHAIETLPYTLNLVLIGELFFDCPQDARRVNSRSLDAVQTFGAVERAKAVRFKVQDDPEHVYAVRLSQAFPGFIPTQLVNICTTFVGEPPKPATTAVSTPTSATVEFQLRSDSTESLADTAEDSARNSMMNISSGSNSCAIPNIQTTTIGSGGSLSSSPVIPSRLNGGSICSALLDRGRQSSNCLLADRQLSAQRNRGRRVSFGAIRAIPPSDLSSVSASASTSPLLVRSSGSSHRLLLHSTTASNSGSEIPEEQQLPKPTHVNAEFEDEGGHVQTSDVIHNYVDRMLQSAMDEVLIDN